MKPAITHRLAVGCFALILAGCQQEMADQPRYDPYEASPFFADGMSARPRVPGAVARGELDDDPLLLPLSAPDSAEADRFPMPVTTSVLRRGQERYRIYCQMCHDPQGTGHGQIVERGFSRPPSYHDEEVKKKTLGHYFRVVSDGFGAMPAHSDLITPEDRWAIIAYAKALQRTRVNLADLPEERRREIEKEIDGGR